MDAKLAPEWQIDRWFNAREFLTLAQLRGRVVLLHAFQMLCPGCVARGIPQMQRAAELFADAPLTVIGVHTVFEHHEAMRPEALQAFLHEYRIRFPVGVDRAGQVGEPMPCTMKAYGMQGTPTTVLIDAKARRRRQVFGHYDDILLGAEIGMLLTETAERHPIKEEQPALCSAGCSGGGCRAD